MNPDVSFQVAALCNSVLAVAVAAGKGPVSRMEVFVFFQA